jgi:predicted enzyme related to lactoylglutathione lyase
MAGRFVWHELLTTDPKGAIAFYTEVIGWKTELYPDSQGPEPYTMWVSGQGSMGGVFTLPEEARKMGAPPHWMGHVQVDDVDATVAKVKAKGGNVFVPPQDIPKVGRFSVIADPQGASLSVFQPEGAMPPHDTNKHGEISWNELYADDANAALSFYGDLFGWKQLQEMDMGPAGKYVIFGQGDQQYGGMMKKTAEMGQMPPSWVYYIHVDDLDAAISRATSKGGKVLFGPIEVPDGTRVAQLTDPQGAHFALHGPKK